MKTGVILVNLGTPQAPTAIAVARFLKEFLSDPRVVETPRWLWWGLLNGVILPLRTAKVTRAYRAIWTLQGSPLRVITEAQTVALERALQRPDAEPAPLVTFAMTYGGPSVASRIAELQAAGVEKFLILPLYPQYSATTTGAVYDQVANLIKASRDIPEIAVVKQYWHHAEYVEALAATVVEHWNRHGRGQQLLMSFHGLPADYVARGDPYRDQCVATANALAAKLALPADAWAFGFQSRFGRRQWIRPYADDLLREFAHRGVSRVDVICPSFAADCLETREEINIQSRKLFVAAGGTDFALIPCLNASPEHIELLAQIVARHFALD